MSGLFRPRNLVIVGGVVAGVMLFPRTASKVNPVGNPFETPAVRSVGDRYSAGGGTTTHMPGVATPRGKADNVISPQSQSNGPGSAVHEEKMEQRADQDSVVAKAYRQAHYGKDKGK